MTRPWTDRSQSPFYLLPHLISAPTKKRAAQIGSKLKNISNTCNRETHKEIRMPLRVNNVLTLYSCVGVSKENRNGLRCRRAGSSADHSFGRSIDRFVDWVPISPSVEQSASQVWAWAIIFIISGWKNQGHGEKSEEAIAPTDQKSFI